ncbi:hypothetical protein HYPGJ_20406 [Hyphomicrobium sp. GJ21]|nr:hypothetical protein HYPGJ_20406 [Hyphomicrobium sp. GJ21]
MPAIGREALGGTLAELILQLARHAEPRNIRL